MKKIKEVLLFVIVLVLLVGVASAADIQNKSTSDTITTQSTDINTKETVQNTNTITDNIEKNIINEKKINKKEKNLKTESQTHNVANYDQLSYAMNSTDEEVTININSNITLTASPTLNTNIKTLTINGNSYTINGNNKYRFLNITSNQMVNINNITITNCYTTAEGGAIYNNGGTLNITQSNLNNNTATGQTNGYGGAIYNSGNLTINNSTLKNNTATGQYFGDGGAIYNTGGTLNITQSNLTQNKATGQRSNGRGGAIYNNAGTLTITQSNLTQNNATGQQDGYGGAIHNGGGTINITQSNLTQNTATGQRYNGLGGAISNYGTLTITESNLTQNTANGQNNGRGGAIHNSGTLTITQSNLTHNTATGQENGYGGAIYNSNRGNLTITESNLNNNTATGQNGDGIGGAIYNIGGTLNITQSNLNNNTATGQNGDGIGGAICNDGGNLTITDSNLYNNTAVGQGQYGYGYGGAIHNYAETINITNANITNNTATGERQDGYGGAIYNYYGGNLTITQSNLNNNTATGQTNGYGGAIYNNGTLNITDSNLTQNTATGQSDGCGGAIYNNGGNLNITQSNLTQNTATGQKYNGVGGAIYNYYGGNLTITESNLTQNTATGQGQYGYGYGFGGAIYNSNRGNLTITQSNLNNNTASSDGGAIENYGLLIIIHSILENNKAGNPNDGTGLGGAIDNYDGSFNISNSTLTNNTAYKDGAAIYNDNGDVVVEENNFIANNAPKNGEPIKVVDDSQNVKIEDNIGDDTTAYKNTIYINTTWKGSARVVGNVFYDEKVNTTLTISSNNTNPYVYDVINLTIHLTDMNNKNLSNQQIIIKINNQEQTLQTNQYGIAYLEYMPVNNQTITVNASHPETTSYNYSTQSISIPVEKINTTLNISKSDGMVYVNKTFNITVELLDVDKNGVKDANITLTIKNTTDTLLTYNNITGENGKLIYPVTVNNNDTITVEAKYANESTAYKDANATLEFNVEYEQLNTTIEATINNTQPYVNDTINITYTLKDQLGYTLPGQNITVTIKDQTNTITTNTDGIASIEYTPTNNQTTTITATYQANKPYQENSTTIQITANKIDTQLTLQVSNTTPINNTPINITITLTDTDGNKLTNQNITLKVSDKTFNIKTSSNGIATQTYTPTTLGKQTITVTYKGDSQYVNSTATTTITVKKINTKIDLKVSNTTPINNTPITITMTLTDVDNNKLANQQVTLNINGKTVTAKTNTNGIITQNYTPTKVETQNITATYTGDSRYNNSTKTIQITVKNKIKTKTTVNPAIGVIGEKLTVKATVTDTNGNNVNEGNLIFKVNGVTIKDNGKLTGSSNPLKIKVVNGVATATIIPDINMTNAKNITAYYVGTTIYNASTSSPASMNISKRNATIEVTTNKKIIKQGQVLTITAKIYDTTNGKKTSNITRYQDEYVYFKVNGITLKDANGEMLKVKIINGTATVNYTIPLGISCVIDTQSMTPKNHTIQVGLYNKNYQNIMTKTPTFQTERSNITINLANATINNKTHTLSMKITIKDYLKNTVLGPNKLVIKVNGLTLKNGTNIQYYYTTDGVLNLKNIPIPTAKNYTSIEVITQDRLAYNSQRNTTKVIKITN